MILLFLGIMDFLSASSFIFIQLGWFQSTFYWFIIGYLGIKAIAFRSDIASLIDGFCAVFLVLMLLGLRSKLVWIPILYLFQKSLFSFKSLF